MTEIKPLDTESFEFEHPDLALLIAFYGDFGPSGFRRKKKIMIFYSSNLDVLHKYVSENRDKSI